METLEVDDNKENQDRGKQISNIWQVFLVKSLLKSTNFVTPSDQ